MATDTPSSEQIDVLLAIAAKIDAVFTPTRPQLSTRGIGELGGGWIAAVYETRHNFAKIGVPYVTGGSIAARQASYRMLGSLVELDLLIIHTSSNRRVRVTLTNRGDLWARSLTYQYLPCEVWPLFKTVARLTDLDITNTGSVPETAILGKGYDVVTSPDLVGLETQMIPLLTRGWLTTEFDLEGRTGYSITDSGRITLKRRKPRRPRWLPDPRDAAFERFQHLYLAALADRETWTCGSSHVHIPLSCGMWPEWQGVK